MIVSEDRLSAIEVFRSDGRIILYKLLEVRTKSVVGSEAGAVKFDIYENICLYESESFSSSLFTPKHRLFIRS